MADKNSIPRPSAGDVFEKTYQMYLKQIGERDLARIAKRLNEEMDRDLLPVRLFGRRYHVGGRGIEYPEDKTLNHAEIVVLCKYVILYPQSWPFGDNWIHFKDFRDAGPLVDGFNANAGGAVARAFSGKAKDLEKACDALGGSKPHLEQPLSYDVIRMFQALPDVPLLLLFNDADEEFPAEAAIMFESRADKFLDMECLSMLGWLLADYLVKTRAAGELPTDQQWPETTHG